MDRVQVLMDLMYLLSSHDKQSDSDNVDDVRKEIKQEIKKIIKEEKPAQDYVDLLANYDIVNFALMHPDLNITLKDYALAIASYVLAQK